MICSLR